MAEIASAIIAGTSLATASITQISGAINTGRNASIEITNNIPETNLRNPDHYCNSGYCYTPPQTIIKPHTRECLAFSKNSDSACGSVFVFSYQVGNGKRFAVMGSVPYDYNWYENWMAVGIMDESIRCSHELYDRMYNRAEFESGRSKAAAGPPVHASCDEFKVSVTMSAGGKCIMKVDVYPNGT